VQAIATRHRNKTMILAIKTPFPEYEIARHPHPEGFWAQPERLYVFIPL
jgi:hypothetical protein